MHVEEAHEWYDTCVVGSPLFVSIVSERNVLVDRDFSLLLSHVLPPSLTGRRCTHCPVHQVEGGLGVSKLAACISALPPTALRVVIVGAGSSGAGLEEELGGLLESRLWTDSPERTLVFALAATESEEVSLRDAQNDQER